LSPLISGDAKTGLVEKEEAAVAGGFNQTKKFADVT